jgi:hypothetical protein
MTDESKPISASDIVDDPGLITTFVSEYVIIKDTSLMGTYKNLIEAINLFGEYGWETVSMTNDNASGGVMALVRNTRFKRKREKEASL